MLVTGSWLFGGVGMEGVMSIGVSAAYREINVVWGCGQNDQMLNFL